MIGWLFFIASCYIVTFIAKCINKGINNLMKQFIKAYRKLRQPEVIPTSEVKGVPSAPEVANNVH